MLSLIRCRASASSQRVLLSAKQKHSSALTSSLIEARVGSLQCGHNPPLSLQSTIRNFCSSPADISSTNTSRGNFPAVYVETSNNTATAATATAYVSKSVEDRLYAIIHGINGAKFRIFLRSQIKILSEDSDVLAMAKAKYMDEKLWVYHAFNFRRQLAKAPENVFQGSELINFLTLVENIFGTEKEDTCTNLESSTLNSADQRTRLEEVEQELEKQFRALLLSSMMQRADTELREEIASSRTLLRCSDLRLPHEWYAPARLMKRKIIYHGGPTNSGAYMITI